MLGLALFGLHAVVGDPAPGVLRLEAARVSAIEAEQARRLGRPPTSAELDGAITAAIDEELAVREARALGLEEADPIVRRRLLQKMEAVDLLRAGIPEPDDATLADWFVHHMAEFRVAPRVATSLVYLSSSRRADPEADGAALLARLEEGAELEGLGDPWPHGARSGLQPVDRAAAELGLSDSDTLLRAPVGSWGLVAAAAGAFLLRVDAREPARLPELAEIRGRVADHWRAAQEAAAKQEAAKRRRAEARIVVERP